MQTKVATNAQKPSQQLNSVINPIAVGLITKIGSHRDFYDIAMKYKCAKTAKKRHNIIFKMDSVQYTVAVHGFAIPIMMPQGFV